ncbi:DsrE family protein [Stygiolobus azoricus]|uniref:DsrE family protein n=1 Tax=Stygiolobus azoricus TaxID=41675 RepID=UPI001E3FAAF4|nr:DsrE family protein [Stygiolobus azoricus]
MVQVSEKEKINQAVKSVMNLINDLGEELEEVEVVFHQSAITATIDEGIIKPLLEKKINVIACRNSLISQGINESSLVKGVKIVNSGVGEVVRRQKEGWIYLRL